MVLCAIRLIRNVRANLKLAKSDQPEKVVLSFDEKLHKSIKRALSNHHGRCDLERKVMKVLLNSQATKAAIAKGIITTPIRDDDDLRMRLCTFFHWTHASDIVYELMQTRRVPGLWWQCEVNHQARPASLSKYSFLFVLQLAVNALCEQYMSLLEEKDPLEAAKVRRRSSSISNLELARNEFRWKARSILGKE